jgi:hypothetical protein
MRTLLQRIAVLALPFTLLVVSACSGHHRFHHEHDAWRDEAYDRESSVDHYDGRGPHNGWGQYNRGGRYDGNDREPWLRW